MKNELEKNIKQAFQGYTIEPSQQIWDDIEKALNKKKKRRIVAWWWLPFIFFFIATIVLWQIQNNSFVEKGITTNQNEKSLNSENTHISNNKLNNSSTAQLAKVKKIEINSSQTVTEKKILNSERIVATKNSTNVISGNNSVFLKEESNVLPNANKTKTVLISYLETFVQHRSKKRENIELKDTTLTIVKKTDSLISSQLLSNKKQFEKSKIVKQFIFGGGSFTQPNASSQLEASPAYNSASLSLALNTAAQLQSIKNGWYLYTGINLNYSLNQKFELSIGLHYQYLQSTQMHGILKDSALRNTNSYFYAGSSNSSTNNLHQINIPILAKFYINSKKSAKLFFQSGIEANFNFAKKWLVPQADLNGYYYNHSAINNCQINGIIGFGAVLKNGLQISISSKNSLSRFYNNNKINTQQIGAQIAFPFHSKKSK